MINQYIVAGIFGFVGGLARASIGLLKALKEGRKFNAKHFIISLIASGFVGVFAGLLYDTNYKLTLIAGYAGTDLIEGIYKIKNPKSKLFS